MDLVADMLVAHLSSEHKEEVQASLIRPSMPRRAQHLAFKGVRAATFTIDRITARLWDYPRLVAAAAPRFDVFHVVDHSYAQLVHRLPGDRTLVTCHDIDAFRSVFEPDAERRSPMFRRWHGTFQRAAQGRLCRATRRPPGTRSCSKGAVDPARTSVVHNGLHQS